MNAVSDALDLDRAFRSGLKLGHLRVLAALERVGRVGRVAELFHVTQPAISKQLGEIEGLLGMPVVQRQGRSVVLTAAGEVLARHGRHVLHSLDAAHRELEDLREGLAGTLRVGAVATVMPTLVARGVARLRQRAPGVALTLKEATTDELFPLLREGALDLVVSRTRVGRNPGDLQERLLGRDPMVLACSAQHLLVARKRVRWTDLASQPWILPPEGSAIHAALQTLFDKHGMRPEGPGVIANSVAVMPRLLLDGDLVGLLPRAYAQDLIDRRQLAVLPLEVPNAAQEVRALWRRGHDSRLLHLMLQSLAPENGIAGAPAR